MTNNNTKLSPIISTHLKNTHGFYTRQGGYSSGEIASLNCGFGADEDPEIVTKNRQLIATALKSEHQIQTVFQHHSSDVHIIEKPFSGNPPKADALVTRKKDLPIAVLTADCGPVLFESDDVIAAAHAGWKGAFGGILENTVEAMRSLGARQIKAAIGPLISQKNYEVGEEFVEVFCDEDQSYSQFFSGSSKIYFDLPRFILKKLHDCDVDAEWVGHCTYENPEKFYSYRRSTHENSANYGRLLSVIKR